MTNIEFDSTRSCEAFSFSVQAPAAYAIQPQIILVRSDDATNPQGSCLTCFYVLS